MLYKNVLFCNEFRDYQQRVLDTLAEKSEDNKIHIVAAPGSGKTVLGLEIIRRFDKPCLILTPSISIREQWISRFMDLFVLPEDKEYWRIRISNDIDNPGIITCVTYQALFSLYADDRLNAAMTLLKSKGYGCICLDESHHLKKEWWKVLEQTVRFLDNPVLISLTATPPYDSDNQEWTRYNSLCGPIDCEVLTPEMVKKGALCPYQDHVYISVPTIEEINEYKERAELMGRNIREILTGELLYRLLRDYDALISPYERPEVFIEEPRFLNALVAYLHHFGIESAVFYEKEKQNIDRVIDNWSHELVSLAYEENVPELTGELLEIFLEVIIKKDAEHFEPELLREFTEELSRKHFYKNNRIHIFDHRDELEKISRNSISKIEAIRDIVAVEAVNLGKELQMVILLDLIGREDLSKIGGSEKLDKLNCVSVFESIRRAEHLNNLDNYMKSNISFIKEMAGTNLGLLCGSFAILPDAAASEIGRSGKELGQTGYFCIDISDSERSEIVAKVTKLLEKRVIRILVGTVSLLGEGWDAPSINTVVIGSTISSFVQTNQMRGRGMRLDKNAPDKIANIWHLVTLNPDLKRNTYVGGADYVNLVRRFDTILGISSNGEMISSGIGRLGLPSENPGRAEFAFDFINAYSRKTLAYASNREEISNQWARLMYNSGDCSITRDMVTLRSARLFRWKDRGADFNIFEIRRIAKGLHRNMCELGMIPADSVVRIKSNLRENRVGVYLDYCRPKDGKLFINYYEQMTAEIVAPRYLLCKGYGSMKKYIALPDYLKNKESANRLAGQIGFFNSNIIYTRNPEGLNLLFDLRLKHIKVDNHTAQKVRMVVLNPGDGVRGSFWG